MDETSHHTILYRSGLNPRVDRSNINLFQRVTVKSTTPVFVEIFYHEPLRLSEFAAPQERMRFVKLRSGEDFPVAERLRNATTDCVLVLHGDLLYAAQDIWRLLGLASRKPLSSLTIARSFVDERPSLTAYLEPEGKFEGRAFAINQKLFPQSLRSFEQKIDYWQLLRSFAKISSHTVLAKSIEITRSFPTRWLESLAVTIAALRRWKAEKQLPREFSTRRLLFHVAQIATYLAAMVALLSPVRGLVLFAFAIAITPQFFLKNLKWRRLTVMMKQLTGRLSLYLVG